MIAPHYNSRLTKVAVVVKGSGWSQMACPLLGQKQRGGSGGEHGQEEQERQEGQESYHTVNSQLKDNTILIIPAGLPSVTVASRHENREIVCFNINSKNNNLYFLAAIRSHHLYSCSVLCMALKRVLFTYVRNYACMQGRTTYTGRWTRKKWRSPSTSQQSR